MERIKSRLLDSPLGTLMYFVRCGVHGELSIEELFYDGYSIHAESENMFSATVLRYVDISFKRRNGSSFVQSVEYACPYGDKGLCDDDAYVKGLLSYPYSWGYITTSEEKMRSYVTEWYEEHFEYLKRNVERSSSLLSKYKFI